MRKWLLALCMILALMACKEEKKESAQVKAKPVVRFAALYPLSGDGAQYGETAQKVAKMFFDDFNQKNPQAKYDYQVIFEDVQWSAAKTASAVKKVIDFDTKKYLLRLFFYVIVIITACFLSYFICNYLTTEGFVDILVRFIISSSTACLLFVLFFFWTDEFKYMFSLIKKIIRRRQ